MAKRFNLFRKVYMFFAESKNRKIRMEGFVDFRIVGHSDASVPSAKRKQP